MIRRSRISVRPNVKPTGRIPAAPRDATQENKTSADIRSEPEDKPGGLDVSSEAKPVPAVPPPAQNNDPGDTRSSVTSQSECSAPPAAEVATQNAPAGSLSMRRKRFSVLPNISKPRSTPAPIHTVSKSPKSPVRTVPTSEIASAFTQTSSKSPKSPVRTTQTQESPPDLPSTSVQLPSESPNSPVRAFSASSCTSSATPTSPVATQQSAPDQSSRAPKSKSAVAPKLPPSSICYTSWLPKSPVKPSHTPESAPNLPPSAAPPLDEESRSRIPIAQHKTAAQPYASIESASQDPASEGLIDSENEGNSGAQKQKKPTALRTLNDPGDQLLLARARKLRELLKKQMNKDKKLKRPKMGVNRLKLEKDHTKMTMRELIYYLPRSNPMKSFVEDEPRPETLLPFSPEAASVAEVEPAQEEVQEEEEQGGGGGGGGGEEEALLAPRVKVAEDGSLIIDEESLTVRVQRATGPNPAEDRDPIFERGSTTTYSSFRKGSYTKPWSSRETDMFFLAISMVGTDFSMISQMFPHRARIEIKNKFKKEERANSWRIDKAFKEKRRLDLEFFENLLAQILKDEEEKRRRKKGRSKLGKVPQNKAAVIKQKMHSLEEEGEEESFSSDAMEGEKENEDVCNDAKRRSVGASPKRKHVTKADEQGDGEDPEKSSGEDLSPLDRLQKSEAAPEASKPNTCRKRKNTGTLGQRKSQDAQKSSKDSSSTEKKKRLTDVISCEFGDSEDEDEPNLTAVQEHILNKPTRSGRIPKLSQHVIRAAAAEEEEAEEEDLPAPLPLPCTSPAWAPRRKPGRSALPRRGKSQLVMIRATKEEEEEEDEEESNQVEGSEGNGEEENQAFVPMGLRSVSRVQHEEVEITLEELDISIHLPDVLDVVQNAACPESSCQRPLAPVGPVPSEHQLDLLVDVIEFLDPNHMEVSEEAARTLLTIGHSAYVTQTPEPSSRVDDIIIVEESLSPFHPEVQEEVVVEMIDQSEAEVQSCHVVTLGIPEPPPEQDSAFKDEPISSQDTAITPGSSQSDVLKVQEVRRNRLPKCRPRPRPRPNLSRASRTTQASPRGLTQTQTEPEPKPEPEPEPEPGAEGLKLSGGASDGHEWWKPISEDTGCVDEQTLHLQQIHSDSEAGAENPSALSQCEKRNRRIKPKPNLIGTSRTTQASPQEFPQTQTQPDPKPHPEPKPEPDPKAKGLNLRGGASDGHEWWKPISEDMGCVDEQRLHLQQIHSDSEAGAENPTELSQCEKRNRRIKPKPNLIRTSRTTDSTNTRTTDPTKTKAQQNTAELGEVLDCGTQRSEEGYGITTGPEASQNTIQEETKTINSLLPDVHSEEVHHADVCDSLIPSSDEPVFILTLSEISPTSTKEAELETEVGQLPAALESLPEPISAVDALSGGAGSVGDQVSVLYQENQQIPAVGLEVEASHGSESEINAEVVELPAKRKLPEGRRRAKVQIKPNPVPRKTLHDDHPHSSSSASSQERTLILQSSSETQAPPTEVSSQSTVGNVVLPETKPAESNSGLEAESQPVQQITPEASAKSLTRPGRRPKGFLSFMSSTSSQRTSSSSSSFSSSSRVPQKPSIIRARTERRRATPTPFAPPTSAPQVREAVETSSSKVSAEEEPTSVAAYFFNDIFTMVDESE